VIAANESEVKLRLSLPRFAQRYERQDLGRLITCIRREFGYSSRHIKSNPLPPDGNDDAVSLLVRRNHAKPMLIEGDNFGCVRHAPQCGTMAKREVKSKALALIKWVRSLPTVNGHLACPVSGAWSAKNLIPSISAFLGTGPANS